MTAFDEKRFGRFHVGREALYDNLGQYVYQGMIPMRVEFNFCLNRFDVIACSEHFEPVKWGDEIPFYDYAFEWTEIEQRDITGVPIGGSSKEFHSIRWMKRES